MESGSNNLLVFMVSPHITLLGLGLLGFKMTSDLFSRFPGKRLSYNTTDAGVEKMGDVSIFLEFQKDAIGRLNNYFVCKRFFRCPEKHFFITHFFVSVGLPL